MDMSHDLAWGRRFLMCSPEHFDVLYTINPWMDPAVAVARELAQRQWDALVEALRAAGAEVELLDPQPGLPDLVFTANLGIVDGETFVPARMRHRERREEAGHAIRWFAAHGFAIETLPGHVTQEGAGDALPFGDTLVAGHRGRSSESAYGELANLVDGAIATIELADPRYYHVDIAFGPLDARTAIYAPSALTAEGVNTIERLVPDAVVLTEQEAAAFCANCVTVGRTVVMPACPPRLERELRARGFTPQVVDVSEFLKAGGGPRCLTLALDVRLGASVAERFTARNYHPLPVTVTSAQGAWVTDDRGRRYLDALSAYSALNFGHRHPKLVAAAHAQLDRLTLTSRAFGNDQLGPFARDLAALCEKDRVLPMNTGAEAVETAVKAARRWGYEVKGVRPDNATIVVCDGNFHGRTTTIVSFSDDPLARTGYGPFTPGFVRVPYGDAAALAGELADNQDVVAFLVEPVQGEAGVVVPPDGYLREVRRLCSAHGVLMIADEIQSGLGRTGRTFGCDHEDVVLGVFEPGSHGSTFSANPLAYAVGRAVLALLETGEPQAAAARTGAPEPGLDLVGDRGVARTHALGLVASSARRLNRCLDGAGRGRRSPRRPARSSR